MTQEEKVNLAKEWYNDTSATKEEKSLLEKLFPEFRESEDDKLRKALLKNLTERFGTKGTMGNNLEMPKVIAWLEKQTIDISSFPEEHWVEEYWKHHKVTNPDSYNGGEEIQFDHDGFVRFCQTHCQKSAWSEEDEKIWTTISDLLWEGYKLSDKKVSWNKIRYWLLPKIICLKDRVQPQSKQEWSEEDERICQCLIKDQKEGIDKVNNSESGHTEIISDLKEMYRERINWLESIKERYTWKPSDEQITSLRWMLNKVPYCRQKEEISGLLDQIKNL